MATGYLYVDRRRKTGDGRPETGRAAYRIPALCGESRAMLIDLKDKVAIVTGAGRGIGREIARTLAEEGAITYATDVNREYLDDLDSEFAAKGWRGGGYLCDVRYKTRIRDFVEEIANRDGRIDILVNNAGVLRAGSVE